MRRSKRPKVANFRGNAKFANRGGMRRVNLIGQTADQSEDSSELDVDKIVLRLEGGNGAPPFMLKGKLNKLPFTTKIDSGSRITIFTKEDVRNILKSDLVFTRPLSKNEQYVDYNGKPLNVLGFKTVDVQVRKRNIKKASLVIARDGKRPLFGRDWSQKEIKRQT